MAGIPAPRYVSQWSLCVAPLRSQHGGTAVPSPDLSARAWRGTMTGRSIPGPLHLDNTDAIDWGQRGLVAYGCQCMVAVVDPVNPQVCVLLQLSACSGPAATPAGSPHPSSPTRAGVSQRRTALFAAALAPFPPKLRSSRSTVCKPFFLSPALVADMTARRVDPTVPDLAMRSPGGANAARWALRCCHAVRVPVVLTSGPTGDPAGVGRRKWPLDRLGRVARGAPGTPRLCNAPALAMPPASTSASSPVLLLARLPERAAARSRRTPAAAAGWAGRVSVPCRREHPCVP